MHLEQANRQTDGCMDRQTDKQTGTKTAGMPTGIDRWTDKQAEKDEQAGCRQPDRQELDNQGFFTPSTPPPPTHPGQQNKGGCQQKPDFHVLNHHMNLPG